MMGERSVNEVDKEQQREKGDSFIFKSNRGKKIGAVRKCVRTCKLGSRDMDHSKLKVCQIKEPTGLMTIQCLGFAEVD